MTTARHLETIDLLRSRAFPTEFGPSDVGTEGPGFHIAELNGHFGDGVDGDGEGDGDIDPTAEGEQRVVEHDDLLDGLTDRWGEPDLFSLASTQLRDAAEEDLPEPWLRLSRLVGWLHLWRTEGRWIGIGLAESQLLAVVTETDPP
ncbi:hypothetical protein OG729_33920 [Streptomyces sp. NBC_00210]|uniref:hypothetical protein n=1 Tax=unclassified Streptomyces TaxID=2593676 RepID=UPI003249B726